MGGTHVLEWIELLAVRAGPRSMPGRASFGTSECRAGGRDFDGGTCVAACKCRPRRQRPAAGRGHNGPIRRASPQGRRHDGRKVRLATDHGNLHLYLDRGVRG
jgi:hypothetical protein